MRQGPEQEGSISPKFKILSEKSKKNKWLACIRIKKRRNRKKKNAKNVWKFQVPKLNFKTMLYSNYIDWASIEISEFPITNSLLSEET